jgi:hypothetical protein
VFRVRHPLQPAHADCGYDPTVRGYFVELTADGVAIAYDATNGWYDDESPLLGALALLSAYGFVDPAAVDEALALSGGVTAIQSGRVRRALRVIRAFEEEAGG